MNFVGLLPDRLMKLLLPFALLPFALGCGSSPKADVVASTGMIADATKRIAGPHLSVECLMGPGIDPHKYQPPAGDAAKLASARLVLFNGLHLEGKMVDVLEKPAGGRKAVAVTRALDHAKLRKADTDGGAHDPHVWFDVSLWMKCVEVIRDELCDLDPAHAAEFRTNAEAYLKELADLHAEVKRKADTLPKERRVLVTSHDAFGYFGDAYGFEVHGLQGVSTASQSGTQDVQDLAKLIGEKKVPAVFTETSVPDQGLKSVLDAVAAKYKVNVKLVGDADALFSDALGPPGSTGETYAGMVRHNIDVMVRALR
jgi:manganese/zinc/iron transport system substrate-binding protein